MVIVVTAAFTFPFVLLFFWILFLPVELLMKVDFTKKIALFSFLVAWLLATITCLVIGEENYNAVIIPPIVSIVSLVTFALINKDEIKK